MRENLGENSNPGLNFEVETPDSPVTIQQDLVDVHLEADQEPEEGNEGNQTLDILEKLYSGLY